MNGEKKKNILRRKSVWIPALGAVLAVLLLALLLPGGIGGENDLTAYSTASPEPTPKPTPEPTPEPAVYAPGYLTSEDGLFHPEQPMTAAEAAEVLTRETGEERKTGAGEEPLEEETLYQLITLWFSPEEAGRAVDSIRCRGEKTVTRAEAAVCFNTLFGLAPETEGYFPDVSPTYWAWDDILAACRNGHPLGTASSPLEEGMTLISGVLYCADGKGYFIKNAYEGSLFFGPDGAYTSGSPELDGYVTEMLRSITEEGMTREEQLRAAYLYVRDSFVYRVRNYYPVGRTGWALDEALTMFSTGKGNCYCYAGAFWAAARGLGYDAKIVSGTYGDTEAPHGWVEIYQDGERFTYDVEIEMANLAKGQKPDMYALNDANRSPHQYEDMYYSDELMPRETNDGLALR